ncbi:Cu(I)-responsive transcriptional regulator [Castellaniella sp. GW247-6E4]|uniref:Cu(I)-responsive transcriptional regulator n=1 Tax=Castellaniella sp. GW247-6E4 TaxID=3140380 RepID=UPI00331597BB
MHTIGQAARHTRLTPKMIRYYESLGLFAPNGRSSAGYRQYDEQDLHVLRFIRGARDLGFSLEQIAELTALWRDKDRSSAEVKRLALDHVAALERKAATLQRMAETLKTFARHCHGDSRPECPILEGLENQAACHSDTKSR